MNQSTRYPYKVPSRVYDEVRAKVSDRAKEIHADALVWDMTLPFGKGWMSDELIFRYRKSGCDLVSLTINDFPGSIQGTTQNIGAVHSMVRRLSSDFVLAKSVDDILAAKANGKTALIFNLQETNPLERNLDMIEVYFELGVRHMLMAYNMKNFVGDGCAEETDSGLSRFGVTVIKEMNRVGMLVDGTHCGYRTSMEAIEVCEGPFIFSHCVSHAIYPHYRNIRDDQIKACAATGGVIGVNGCGFFLGDMAGSVEAMFRHLDRIVSLAGPEHVGLALDYLDNPKPFFDSQDANPSMWPLLDGKPHMRADYVLPEELLLLTDTMLRNGYSEQNVRGILGLNFLRVAGQVWK